MSVFAVVVWCQALGCTTVVCVDKTGTLTQNQMTVQEVHTPHPPLITASDTRLTRNPFSLGDNSANPALACPPPLCVG